VCVCVCVVPLGADTASFLLVGKAGTCSYDSPPPRWRQIRTLHDRVRPVIYFTQRPPPILWPLTLLPCMWRCGKLGAVVIVLRLALNLLPFGAQFPGTKVYKKYQLNGTNVLALLVFSMAPSLRMGTTGTRAAPAHVPSFLLPLFYVHKSYKESI